MLPADETPVAMLAPGKGKTQRAYLWAFAAARGVLELESSLKRWAALKRYLDGVRLPIDIHRDEQQIRPWATRRKNWLYAGTFAAGQRAAASRV